MCLNKTKHAVENAKTNKKQNIKISFVFLTTLIKFSKLVFKIGTPKIIYNTINMSISFKESIFNYNIINKTIYKIFIVNMM